MQEFFDSLSAAPAALFTQFMGLLPGLRKAQPRPLRPCLPVPLYWQHFNGARIAVPGIAPFDPPRMVNLLFAADLASGEF